MYKDIISKNKISQVGLTCRCWWCWNMFCSLSNLSAHCMSCHDSFSTTVAKKIFIILVWSKKQLICYIFESNQDVKNKKSLTFSSIPTIQTTAIHQAVDTGECYMGIRDRLPGDLLGPNRLDPRNLFHFLEEQDEYRNGTVFLLRLHNLPRHFHFL